jgi:hypothetical protein
MDKVGFELFSKNQPAVIAAINTALDRGGKAKQIERQLYKKFGKQSLTASLAA